MSNKSAIKLILSERNVVRNDVVSEKTKQFVYRASVWCPISTALLEEILPKNSLMVALSLSVRLIL